MTRSSNPYIETTTFLVLAWLVGGGMASLSKDQWTLPWPAHSPDLSPVEHVWDRLKSQMPSCHSVHDLELAVQDLSAHLPQDSIRCLIDSMLDHEAACIAAGGGPMRY
ncbi:transposable element Tcb2 transposase [Trichonephila clavipes]|nr:transposable element Tcb2 transposase [Trichonephila clavipes]